MRLGIYPLCWRNNKLSWRESKSSRAGCLKVPVPPMNRIKELQREAFNILPGTVNARRGAAVAHASGISQDIPVAGRSNFENELAKEATWNAHQHP